MPKTKYVKREDYEEFIVNYNEETLKLACCDCGLVHQLAFHVYRGQKLGLAARRLSRATGQLRRHKYGKLQTDNKSRYMMV